MWWYSSTAGGILYKSLNEAFPRGRYAAEVRRAAFGRLSHRNPAALCMGDLKKWEGLCAMLHNKIKRVHGVISTVVELRSTQRCARAMVGRRYKCICVEWEAGLGAGGAHRVRQARGRTGAPTVRWRGAG